MCQVSNIVQVSDKMTQKKRKPEKQKYIFTLNVKAAFCVINYILFRIYIIAHCKYREKNFYEKHLAFAWKLTL